MFRRVPLLFLLWSLQAVAEQLPDPTMPDGYTAGPAVGDAEALSAPDFRVTEIVLSPDRRVAVINGQRLEQGDSFAGGRLVSIQADKVTIEMEDERIEVPLIPLKVKKPVDIGRGEK